MRLRFPQDRTVFQIQGDLLPILSPPATSIDLFLDEACEQQADLTTLDGAPIAEARIVTEEGLLPEFLGPPDGTARLWGRTVGHTEAYPIDASLADLVDIITEAAGDRSYHHVQSTPNTLWVVNHGLGYHPVFYVNAFGVEMHPDRTDPSTDQTIFDWGSFAASGDAYAS
jgi:hypothetical protein